MNVVGPGTLSAVMFAQLRADMESLLQDSDTRTEVAVAIPTGGASIDVATGVATTGNTEVTTTGWLSDLTWKQINDAGGSLQLGDRMLMVPTADLATAPEVGAIVVAGTTRYAVLSVDTDPLSLRYRFALRRTT